MRAVGEEGDVELMMDLLDALAEGHHGPGRRIEQICNDHGISVHEVTTVHDRIIKELGRDDFWQEEE